MPEPTPIARSAGGNIWYDWYGELAAVLYGETGTPSHNMVKADFVLLKALLEGAVGLLFDQAARGRAMPSGLREWLDLATPLVRASDPSTNCPECGGEVWQTTGFPDALHKPACKGKPSWWELMGETPPANAHA